MRYRTLSFLIPALVLIACKSNTDSSNNTIADTNTTKTIDVQATNVGDIKPVNISKQEFLDKIMNYEANPKTWVFEGKKPCIVDFYADWCAPCRMTAPILDDLAKEYAGKVDFYKVDVERERELASFIGISSIPTFLACPLEGKPKITKGVGRTPEETKQMFITMLEEITR